MRECAKRKRRSSSSTARILSAARCSKETFPRRRTSPSSACTGARAPRDDGRRDRAVDERDAGLRLRPHGRALAEGRPRADAPEIAETPAWVLPSPNMPTPETALVYPGGCLVEGTKLSEGRGTTRPFELLGAPWLDADEAAERANALGMPGVVFAPTSSAHVPEARGEDVRRRPGARDGRGGFPPLRDVPRLLKALFDLDPNRFRWRTERYEYRDDVPAIDLLTGTATYRRLVAAREVLDPGSPRSRHRAIRLHARPASSTPRRNLSRGSSSSPGRTRRARRRSPCSSSRRSRRRAEGRLPQAHGPQI